MDMERIIALYMDDCHSRQLRPKTMQSYEQALKLFATWLEEMHGVTQVEQVKDVHIRSYINDLQKRGKYTLCADQQSEAYNHPTHRRDDQGNMTVTFVDMNTSKTHMEQDAEHRGRSEIVTYLQQLYEE